MNIHLPVTTSKCIQPHTGHIYGMQHAGTKAYSSYANDNEMLTVSLSA